MRTHQLLKQMIVSGGITPKRIVNLIRNYSGFVVKNLHVSGFPSLVMIEPTNLCNLHCPLCPTGNRTLRAPRGYMKFEDYKRIVDEIGDYVLMLTLYNYGEPFLNKNIFEMIEYAKKKRIFIRTSTNGHLIGDKERISRLVKSGLDHMIVSLDGATQETFQKYRVGGNFNKVIENIRMIVEEKKLQHSSTPYIELQFIVMRHNEHEIPIIKKVAEEIGVDRLKLKTTNLSNYPEEDIEKMKEYLPENSSLRRYKLENGKVVRTAKIKNKCIWLWFGTVVNWDGSVVPCCYDPHRSIEVGNAFKENSLKKIWFSERYANLRKVVLNNKRSIKICEKCPGTFTGPDAE